MKLHPTLVRVRVHGKIYSHPRGKLDKPGKRHMVFNDDGTYRLMTTEQQYRENILRTNGYHNDNLYKASRDRVKETRHGE